MFYGLFELPAWGYVLVVLALTHITIASVTIYLHRCQAHRALELHPIASHFFRFWLWLTTGMQTKEWVAVHRKHHAKCETDEDPHSPQQLGIKKVLFEGAELYRRACQDREMIARYGWGTPEDWLEHHIYSHRLWSNAGIVLMLALDVVAFGGLGITVWAIQMVWIPFWAAGVVNGLGHYLGYRNFETQDAATNIIPVGLLIGGEELHNNHHAYPSSAKLSSKWWEFDLGWGYICVLSFLGLAKVKRVAPKVRIERRAAPDQGTVQAVVHNRFHVLKLYARLVILPVLRREYNIADHRARKVLKQIKPLLVREDLLFLKPYRAQYISAALGLSQSLDTVYQFKLKLKEIWTKAAPHPGSRLERLKAWCLEAEQSGIDVLREFAAQLAGYAVQAA
ncbi:MAG: fatty acid desaturase [Methylohalobius sp.]|nr:fatty acid desaturase [Methylohalobius sp.]